MPPNETTIPTKIKRVLAEWRIGSPYLVLCFHRIDDRSDDRSNPFRRLDTQSPRSFRATLRLARAAFDVVSLPALAADHQAHGGRPRLVLTFDDVSRTFLTNALPILEELELPVTLFTGVAQARDGLFWRDLVYFLIDRPELAARVEPIVAAKLGPEAAQQLRTHGLYRWSKRPDVATAALVEDVLKPALGAHYGELTDMAARIRPYMSWADLASVKDHPLITIGSHGSNHYDYRSLDNAGIERDARDAVAAVTRELGTAPTHFALPFGDLDQRVWQTIDRVLPPLGITTAAWHAPYGNVASRNRGRLVHISRIIASEALPRTVWDCVRALAQPLASYSTTFDNARLPGQGDFVTDVPEAEYRHFHSLLMPQKVIHQRQDYYDYLFKNPYRAPDKPAHLGLRYEGNLEAMVSLYWVPFALRGTQVRGPYIAGWWRLPQIHSKIGTKSFLPMARDAAAVLAGYKTSPDTHRLFERDGWSFTELTRYEGALALAKQGSYQVSDRYPAELDPLLAATNRAVGFSIWRDRDYYAYRFEGYPLMRYVYIYDAKPARAWMAVVSSDGTRLYLADVVTAPLTDEAAWRELLAAIADYLPSTGCREVVIETSNAALMRACAAAGLRVADTFINTYFISPALRAQIGDAPVELATHETMACGDKLPEVKQRPQRARRSRSAKVREQVIAIARGRRA